jgi:FkbM family methyltransferase
MNKIKNKTLIESKSSNSNVTNKIRRYFVERELWRLASNNINKNKQVAVFAFDYIGNLINIDGIYEIDDLTIFIKWLESFNSKEIFQGVVLDIGANIGNHSLFFSDYFTEIYSYEPHPLNFKLLSFNASLVSNVKCFNTGISSSEAIGILKYNKSNMGGAQIETINNNISKSFQFKVNLNTIDNLIEIEKKNISVKLIKRDVEGHELEALKGAEKTIKNNQPIIIFEASTSEFNGGTTKVIELLKSYGYNYFAQIDKSPKPPEALPNFIKLIYSTVIRLVIGQSIKINLVENFHPNYYPFIIAIPNDIYLNSININ